jgi:hypothetical protein
MLRIPHCLDSWLTDGGTVVSPMHWLLSIPLKLYLYASGTHFCQRLSEPQDPVRPKGLGKLKEFIHLIGSQTRDLSACSTEP